jgi:hypothetical protein
MITVIGQLTDQLLEMKDRRLSLVNSVRNLFKPIASPLTGEIVIAFPNPTKNRSSFE